MREAIDIGLILLGLFAILGALMVIVARPLLERLAPMPLNDLADLLKRTANAHHAHERINGPDPDWPRWYACHILRSVDLSIRHRRNPVTEEKR